MIDKFRAKAISDAINLMRGDHQAVPCRQWLTVNCDRLIVRLGVMHSALADVSRIPRCHSDKNGTAEICILIPESREARIRDSVPILYRQYHCHGQQVNMRCCIAEADSQNYVGHSENGWPGFLLHEGRRVILTFPTV